MAKNTVNPNVIGDKGEALVRLLISEIAFVNKPEHDQGLDFHCIIRGKEEVEFYIQAKGTEFPEYGEFTINSLPIEVKTITKKWLKKNQPVFVLMADTRKKEIFFLHVTHEIYNSLKIKQRQKTIQFKIPLSNKINESNIGEVFLPSILQNQPSSEKYTLKELNNFLDNYKLTHPYLFHELNEIETYLELLRSPNQDNQIKAQQIIFKKYKRGKDFPQSLVDGTLNIFKKRL